MTITQINSASYARALAKIQPKLKTPLHFLHAPFYGKWKEAAGKKVIYYKLESNNKILGCGIAVAYTLPGGYFFYYSPYGPIVSEWTKEAVKSIEYFFKNLKEPRLLFVRLDATTTKSTKTTLSPISTSLASSASLQPRREWALDITKSDQELLSSMHKKARYYIRMAERRGASVQIKQCSIKQLDKFYELLETTAKRDGFHILPKANYQAAFSALKNHGFIVYAEYEQKIIAAALCVNYDKQTHYVYGSSANEFRSLGVGYLLQWRCIQEAKKRSNIIYNFGGIADNINPDKLSGVTRFKQRFGGYEIHHSMPSDVVISNLGYQLFKLYKRLS